MEGEYGVDTLFFSSLSHALTIFGRGNHNALPAINEIQHRIAGRIQLRAAGRQAPESGPDFTDALAETAAMYGVMPLFSAALNLAEKTREALKQYKEVETGFDPGDYVNPEFGRG